MNEKNENEKWKEWKYELKEKWNDKWNDKWKYFDLNSKFLFKLNKISTKKLNNRDK